MRAIEISEPGGPEVLRLCEREVPVPAVGEVLIKVVRQSVAIAIVAPGNSGDTALPVGQKTGTKIP